MQPVNQHIAAQAGVHGRNMHEGFHGGVLGACFNRAAGDTGDAGSPAEHDHGGKLAAGYAHQSLGFQSGRQCLV